MNVLQNGKIVEVPNNPEHCNNLGEVCSLDIELCKNGGHPCGYLRDPVINRALFSHGTVYELRFLENLGKREFSPRLFNRAFCLRGYQESAEHRTRWGSIDRYVVLQYVEEELNCL